MHVNDKIVPMMLDTGAVYSCVHASQACHLPLSGKFAKTTGFSGNTMLVPITAPVTLEVLGCTTQIPILVSEHTPVSLLGRDALCKMGVQIKCTADGIILDKIGLDTSTLTASPTANVYVLGEVDKPVLQTMCLWEKFIKAQLPNATQPKLPYHCTLKYDPFLDPTLEKLWHLAVENKQVPLTSHHIIIGNQGAALEVHDMTESRIIEEWYQISGSAPHIALVINEGHEIQELGPMMQKATKVEWEPSHNPLILQSRDKMFIKIMHTTTMQARPQEIELKNNIGTQMSVTTPKAEALRAEMEKAVPSYLWAKHATDVGLIKSANPVHVPLKQGRRLPWKAQYPLKPEAVEGIKPTIAGLVEAGVLVETQSCCNTPIMPIQKADKKKWRLVHDLRAVNEIVEDYAAECPNPHTLLTNIPPAAKYFTVIDLSNAYFSVPLAEESKYLFAFQYQGKQYTYNNLPQGYKHSAHIFNQVLKEDLDGLNIQGVLIQYMDDLILCSETSEQCHKDSITVLTKLAEGGHKVSLSKLQYCLPEVDYLGRRISHQSKALAPSHLEGISQAPKPKTVVEMMRFLGITGFSADWIEEYALKIAPLRELIKTAGHNNLQGKLNWTLEASAAFDRIKVEMQNASTLAVPDYTKQFLLYVGNRSGGYGTAVLMQNTCSGRQKQPIAYYSMKLDTVAQGYPPCYQGLAAIQMAYDRASSITMGYPVTIYTHHKVAELIEKGRFVVTNARLLNYLTLLTYPDVTIARCVTVNPAEKIAHANEGTPHNCVSESLAFTKLRPDLLSDPIEDADMELFVDGSCFRDQDGLHAGFAVVKKQVDDTFTTVVSQTCNQPCSSQLAELKALTEACLLGAGKVVNIYTDSAYSHGVCHYFGAVWKQRGFRRADGTSIVHHEQITTLMNALMLPEKVAVIKCQSHKKGNSGVVAGNNAADCAAKLASKCRIAIQAPLYIPVAAPSVDDIVRMQERASPFEKSLWENRGASRDATGTWRSHQGMLVAPTALLGILINEAHGFDHCSRGEILRKIKAQGYWSPYLLGSVNARLAECEVCALNNVRKGIATPLSQAPVPEGPFRSLVMDYVDMLKTVQGKRYMLVIVDRFSRWVEAVPSKDLGAGTVVKFLTREVFPRFGIPQEISSDNGAAFIQKTLKQVLQQLHIKQRLGCVYHPASQGNVEKINGVLKAKISKIVACTKLNWVDALPLALMSYRMQANRMTHLTPHEMLTGRPMPVPVLRGPFKGP